MTAVASPAAPLTPVGSARRPGVRAVLGWEVVKLGHQARTRIVAAACLLAPFAFVAGVRLQSATPRDTPFGRWVLESGFATPLVILNFAGMWVLPLLVSVVAGDLFASEDHFGTWKTVLTRSCGRGTVFAGKALTAAGWSVAVVTVLAVTSLAAGLLVNHQPVVGLSGQLVGGTRAGGLVLASWATALGPVLGYSALALLVSVASRNSAVGMGAPVVAGLVMQLAALVNLPEPVRVLLLATPLVSWHGLWTQPGFSGPLWQGVAVSAAWVAACTSGAWALFRRRDIAVS